MFDRIKKYFRDLKIDMDFPAYDRRCSGLIDQMNNVFTFMAHRELSSSLPQISLTFFGGLIMRLFQPKPGLYGSALFFNALFSWRKDFMSPRDWVSEARTLPFIKSVFHCLT